MCARYTFTRTDLGAVVRQLGAEVDPSAAQLRLPRYNVGPAQMCAIARGGADGPIVTAAVWGLHLGARLVINLRSETAGRRPGLQRCVVPADGFYEWTGPKAHRRPIWFHRPQGEMLYLAALLDEVVGAPPTFAVLTAAAEAPVVEIHDRMPVVLGVERARAWLVEGGRPAVDAVQILATEVSDRVNNVANDDPALLQSGARGQMRLL